MIRIHISYDEEDKEIVEALMHTIVKFLKENGYDTKHSSPIYLLYNNISIN